MTQEDLRQQASISILNALLETTQHSVAESFILKDIYAHVAVAYADALIEALNHNSFEVARSLEGTNWKKLLGTGIQKAEGV